MERQVDRQIYDPDRRILIQTQALHVCLSTHIHLFILLPTPVCLSVRPPVSPRPPTSGWLSIRPTRPCPPIHIWLSGHPPAHICPFAHLPTYPPVCLSMSVHLPVYTHPVVRPPVHIRLSTYPHPVVCLSTRPSTSGWPPVHVCIQVSNIPLTGKLSSVKRNGVTKHTYHHPLCSGLFSHGFSSLKPQWPRLFNLLRYSVPHLSSTSSSYSGRSNHKHRLLQVFTGACSVCVPVRELLRCKRQQARLICSCTFVAVELTEK